MTSWRDWVMPSWRDDVVTSWRDDVMATSLPAAAGVALPPAGLHAARARHLRRVGAAGGGQRPGGGAGEADAEEELLHLHPDGRRERDERGDGQPG